MMAASIEKRLYVFEARGQQQVAGGLRAIGVEADRSETQIRQMGSASKRTGSEMARSLTPAPRLFGKVAASALLAAAAIKTLTTGFRAIGLASQRDSAIKGLEALMGSASKAKAHLKDLQRVAAMPGVTLNKALDLSIKLQSVEMDAGLATEAIEQFGNALALAGKEERYLDNIGLALSQMLGRGQVMAEEINQLAEAVPQVRAVMKDAFGTTSAEEIQKLGITAEEFVRILVKGFGELPRAADTFQNKLTNLGSAWTEVLVAFGQGFTGDAGKSALDGLTGALQQLVPLAKAFGETVAASVPAIVQWLKHLFSRETLDSALAGLDGLVAGAKAAWATLAGGFQTVGETLHLWGQKAGIIFQAILGSIGALLAGAKSKLGSLGHLFDGLALKAKHAARTLAAVLRSAFALDLGDYAKGKPLGAKAFAKMLAPLQSVKAALAENRREWEEHLRLTPREVTAGQQITQVWAEAKRQMEALDGAYRATRATRETAIEQVRQHREGWSSQGMTARILALAHANLQVATSEEQVAKATESSNAARQEAVRLLQQQVNLAKEQAAAVHRTATQSARTAVLSEEQQRRALAGTFSGQFRSRLVPQARQQATRYVDERILPGDKVTAQEREARIAEKMADILSAIELATGRGSAIYRLKQNIAADEAYKEAYRKQEDGLSDRAKGYASPHLAEVEARLKRNQDLLERQTSEWETTKRYWTDFYQQQAERARLGADRQAATVKDRDTRHLRIVLHGKDAEEGRGDSYQDRLTAAILGNLGAGDEQILAQARLQQDRETVSQAVRHTARGIADVVAEEVRRLPDEVARRLRASNTAALQSAA